MAEDELIHRIARIVPSQIGRASGVVSLGIGDDAAILSAGGGSNWVVSSDAFLEGVHFLADVHPPDSAGYKALARAASDLVAMGAKPRFFLLTLTLPRGRTGPWLDAFLGGMARATRHLSMRLIGGDTTTGKIVSASLTVFGQTKAGQAITRSGARPGNLIYVSGRLGRAQLGLELMLARGLDKEGKTGDRLARLLEPHLYPRIRVELGSWLSHNRIPSAMMDLSDGLSTDLTRLCQASQVGARLWANRIPTPTIPADIAGLRSSSLGRVQRFLVRKDLGRESRTRRQGLDPLQMALHGGDDYELLFTISPRNQKKLTKAPDYRELTCVGEIVRLTREAHPGTQTSVNPETLKRRVSIIDGQGELAPLEPSGWDPFRSELR